MKKSFNRIWIVLAIAVIMFALSVYFDNPYLNVAIYGIGGILIMCIGAWISDTLNEREQAWVDKYISFMFGGKENE